MDDLNSGRLPLDLIESGAGVGGVEVVLVDKGSQNYSIGTTLGTAAQSPADTGGRPATPPYII